VDRDGYVVTSCAVRRTFNVPVAKAKPLAGRNQIAAMAKLRPLLTANPSDLSHEDAVKEVAAVLTCPQGRRTSVAKETIDRLTLGGHLCFNEGVIKLR